MSIDDILNRLEAAEKEFVGREFLAPVVGHGQVMVRIAGVLCRIHVIDGLPRGFRGWALLQALSTSRARFIGNAGLTQVADYLSLLPAVGLILVQPRGDRWLSLPAQAGDRRFRIEGLVTLELAEEGLERFETVFSRFDVCSGMSGAIPVAIRPWPPTCGQNWAVRVSEACPRKPKGCTSAG